MSWGRLFIVAFAGICACVNPGSAQTQFHSIDQWPGMIDPNAGEVTVANIAAAALSISYLDGVWKVIQIPSGQYVLLPAQHDGLSIRFNDGVETQSATLN